MTKPTPKQVGYHITNWSAAVGISRATFYSLTDESRPQTVKVGRTVVIREAPADWLARVAEVGGAKTVPRRVRRPKATLRDELRAVLAEAGMLPKVTA